METPTELKSGNAAGTADTAELSTPLSETTQLVLWLVATLAHLPDTALAGLGLSREALERLRREHAADIAELRIQQAAVRLMPRSATAELLRCRVNCMALTARTPAELAAVARTVRSLPDWVWEGIVAGDPPALDGWGRPLPVQPGAAGYGGRDAAATNGNAAAGGIPSGAPALNREQRRVREAVLRKG